MPYNYKNTKNTLNYSLYSLFFFCFYSIFLRTPQHWPITIGSILTFNNLCVSLQRNKTPPAMSSTAIDTYMAEIQASLNEIAGDEAMLARVTKYLRRLVKERKPDPTCMSKEEFFARVDRARQSLREGKGIRMLPNESLSEFLERTQR